MDSAEDIILEAEEKMEKSVQRLHSDFAGLRTGKASPTLVENVSVPYYGTPTRLRELASITTPEPRLIVINPFDPTSLAAIEKAILTANLGVTPVSDGRIVRIPIPELSEERRKEMVKVAKRMAEETRVAVRGDRREANDALKALQKKGDITEDDLKIFLQDMQETTDGQIETIDKALETKEQDMMAV